jgi:hypothetical protein
MSRARFVILSLSIVGLAFSSWHARPSDLGSLNGWVFACLWSSLAWCLLCGATVRLLSIPVAIGALFALGGSELLLFALSADPLLLAVKPIYQIPIGAFGSIIVFFGWRSHVQNA